MGPLKVLTPFYIARIETAKAPNRPETKFRAELRSDSRITGPLRDTFDEAEADGPTLTAKIVPGPTEH